MRHVVSAPIGVAVLTATFAAFGDMLTYRTALIHQARPRRKWWRISHGKKVPAAQVPWIRRPVRDSRTLHRPALRKRGIFIPSPMTGRLIRLPPNTKINCTLVYCNASEETDFRDGTAHVAASIKSKAAKTPVRNSWNATREKNTPSHHLLSMNLSMAITDHTLATVAIRPPLGSLITRAGRR